MCSSTLGALSRVDEGKKRLASWEVLHMLEEGLCARAQDGGTGSCLVSRGGPGRVDYLTPRDGKSWWCTRGSLVARDDPHYRLLSWSRLL